jgi:hypothetical protein
LFFFPEGQSFNWTAWSSSGDTVVVGGAPFSSVCGNPLKKNLSNKGW